jgi:acyl-coenzyme A synthetase/AMP-(fatty) acid ligase/acyl carrier protein
VTDATHKSLAGTLREKATTLTIDLKDRRRAVENLNVPIPATAPAFLIYTSGSTGIPKGVIHNHQSRLYGVMERANAFHLSYNDRISLLTSGTANAIGNSLRTLLSGASLHAFDVKKYGVAALAKWLLEEKITVCSVGVSLFREFCKTYAGEEPFRDLRILGLRSESVLKTDIELYKKHFSPNCLLVNGISVSEAGLLAMYFVDHHTEVCGHEVPVGYAVKDKDISLIDDDGEDVGFNRVGEIVVRSQYLYPGYWNNSDLTAAKFKPDPQDPEKRIYCTGDLGVMLPDGCLIHRGRKDFRLKIRGYGVDNVEAENALRIHPSVKDAIVVGRPYDNGDTRLIAYFTSSIENEPTTSELRKYLTNILADYMIPSAFIRLEVLPVTLNGKIDRRALPDPDHRRPALENPFVAPRTDAEKTVARIVSECTGIEPVGVEDNFFDLGGDSLTLGRLVSRVSAAFERDVPVQYLYESASVAGIARWLEAAASS